MRGRGSARPPSDTHSHMRSARTCAQVTNRSSLYAAGVSGAQCHIKADTPTQPVDLQRNKPRGLDQTQPKATKRNPAAGTTSDSPCWWRMGRDLSRAHAERERKVCNPPARPSVLTFDISRFAPPANYRHVRNSGRPARSSEGERGHPVQQVTKVCEARHSRHSCTSNAQIQAFFLASFHTTTS